MSLDIATSLASVAPAEWNRLAGDDPFLRHEFLSALHETGCAAPETGWTPQFLLMREHGRLAAAAPMYLKTHSYGEYVFDWAWADAYYRHGLHYYPKLLSAIPFTPVGGARLLADSDLQRARLIDTALALAGELGVSSLHCLFPPPGESELMAARGMMLRRGVQFHWSNHGYTDFEQFLAGMNHDKRKKIRQERRRLRDTGIRFELREGAAISGGDWRFFTGCYNQTYHEHHSTPYLNLEFFERIGRTMPENLLLVVAQREGRPIAVSLNVHNGRRLFGRYWGAVESHPALHFETCYYQVIEYCIARGIQTFEGGAQGAHKVARGLLPVETRSAHWLAHPQFAEAVSEFLVRETRGMAHHIDELAEHSPFKRGAATDRK